MYVGGRVGGKGGVGAKGGVADSIGGRIGTSTSSRSSCSSSSQDRLLSPFPARSWPEAFVGGNVGVGRGGVGGSVGGG